MIRAASGPVGMPRDLAASLDHADLPAVRFQLHVEIDIEIGADAGEVEKAAEDVGARQLESSARNSATSRTTRPVRLERVGLVAVAREHEALEVKGARRGCRR